MRIAHVLESVSVLRPTKGRADFAWFCGLRSIVHKVIHMMPDILSLAGRESSSPDLRCVMYEHINFSRLR